jgi:hypothetical protein
LFFFSNSALNLPALRINRLSSLCISSSSHCHSWEEVYVACSCDLHPSQLSLIIYSQLISIPGGLLNLGCCWLQGVVGGTCSFRRVLITVNWTEGHGGWEGQVHDLYNKFYRMAGRSHCSRSSLT